MIRAAILATIVVMPVNADVYRYTGADGRVWLTDHPVEINTAAKPVVHTTIVAKPETKPLTRWEVNHYVHIAAKKYGVDEKLVHAVIKTESTYRKSAISKKGAAGLMQLMPATAERFGVSDRMDERQNIEGGVRFLRFLLDTFKDTKLAVAGYNAGEHAVMRHKNKVPPYPETQNYVGLVMAAYTE
jgi:soluble lytic murein transglycosylase-like protein